MAKEPTTAELIEAIAQCKAEILSAIQAKGGQIDESTPFTEYAYAIENLPTSSIDYTGCRIAIFDYGDRSTEVSTIENNKSYWVELRDENDIPISEPLGGYFDCYAENSHNFSFTANDDHEGGADCDFQIDGAEDGDTITIVYVDANGNDAVELQLTASAPSTET